MRVWIVQNEEAEPVDVDSLTPDQCYLIPVEEKRVIYVWAGAQVPKLKLYKAGTLATKLKSTERLYGFEIQNIEQGGEPSDFPLSACETSPAGGPGKRGAELPPSEPNEESLPDVLVTVKSELAEIKTLLAKIWEKVEGI